MKILFKIGKFFDKYLGWHSCTILGNNGCSNYGICKYCGARCLQDSQGKWFKVENRKGQIKIIYEVIKEYERFYLAESPKGYLECFDKIRYKPVNGKIEVEEELGKQTLWLYGMYIDKAIIGFILGVIVTIVALVTIAIYVGKKK